MRLQKGYSEERFVAVPGKIVGKGRPRFFKGHAVTPRATREAEDRVRAAWLTKYPASDFQPFSGPVSVYVYIYRPMPASRPKAMLSEPDVYRPDLDNVVKLVLDALNGVAYGDDAQVVGITASKSPRWRGQEEKLYVNVCEVGK